MLTVQKAELHSKHKQDKASKPTLLLDGVHSLKLSNKSMISLVTCLTFLTQLFVLLMGMFSDVMLLEMVSTIKALVAHSTRNAARLTMNGLSAPLQRFLGSERLGANVTYGHFYLFLGRWF